MSSKGHPEYFGPILAHVAVLLLILAHCSVAYEEFPSGRDDWLEESDDDDSTWASQSMRQAQEYPPIDAYNLEICGDAQFQPWQREQRNFNCSSRGSYRSFMSEMSPSRWRDESSPYDWTNYKETQQRRGYGRRKGTNRVLYGVDAKDGEVPFFVRVDKTIQKGNETAIKRCGAFIIDKDLLITVPQCVASWSYNMENWKNVSEIVRSVEFVFGTSRLSAKPVVRRIGRWCKTRKPWYSEAGFSGRDGAVVVKLNEPIEYVAGSISPVCLMNSGHKHSTRSMCAAVGAGRGYSNRLKILTMRRRKEALDTYETAEQYYGRLCEGDEGGPMVCYDKGCSKGHPDKVQAFAVGVIPLVGLNNVEAPDCTPTVWRGESITDLSQNLERVYLNELVLAINTGSSNAIVSCYDSDGLELPSAPAAPSLFTALRGLLS